MIYWKELLLRLGAARAQMNVEAGSFAVRPFPYSGPGWIGCSNEAPAVFLLRVAQDGPRPHAISLAAIRARHDVRVRLDDGRSVREEIVSVVECFSDNSASVELFVRCIGSLLETEGTEASGAAIVDALDRLVELFRTLSHASSSEILGLWGELFVITTAAAPGLLAQCWRTRSASRFDFGTENERLEVKATTSLDRKHEVSFDQGNPPTGVAAGFVSIMTEEVASGTTVRELWMQAIDLVPEQQAKIDRICVYSLGRDWHIAQERAFDFARAVESSRVYDSRDIPAIRELPDGVARVRFASDFGRAHPWSRPAPSNVGPISAVLAGLGRGK